MLPPEERKILEDAYNKANKDAENFFKTNQHTSRLEHACNNDYIYYYTKRLNELKNKQNSDR